jgi:hypothetical protein
VLTHRVGDSAVQFVDESQALLIAAGTANGLTGLRNLTRL